MEHDITVLGRVFEVTATGSATPQGFIALYEDVIKNQNWSPGCCLVVDFRQLTDFNTEKMDFKGVSSVASFLKRHSRLLNCAFLVGVERFELSASSSRTMRADRAALHPENLMPYIKEG